MHKKCLKEILLKHTLDKDFKPQNLKDYLNNFDQGVIIGRAQFDYHITPRKNNHLMFTAGILEEMFSGYGFEYLYFVIHMYQNILII